MSNVRAAVAHGPGQPFSIEDVELDDPRDDEVLVRIVATGLCHTDLVMRDSGKFTPGVLGHEGAGVVERIGAKVTTLRPGDHVVLSYYACRDCVSCRAGAPAYCARFTASNYGGARPDGSRPVRLAGKPIASSFFYQSSFATHAIVHEHNAISVPKDLPLDTLGPLGCSVLTGAGAVLHALAVEAGQRVAIFGAGAVGLAAVMAARVAGASTIIAVDRNVERLRLAAELGATLTLSADGRHVASEVRKATRGGVDVALECVGAPDVLRTAFECLGPRGTCGLVGVAKLGALASINMTHLFVGRTLTGIVAGNVDPHAFVPRLLELHRAGELPFERLIRHYPLEAINDAVADCAAGTTIKAVLRTG